MQTPAGSRVLVLRNADGEKKRAYVYGEGTYIGNRRPPDGTRTPFGLIDATIPPGYVNPCIVLDDGRVVWGCQSWWGPPEQIRKRLEGYEFETVDVNELANPPLPAGAH